MNDRGRNLEGTPRTTNQHKRGGRSWVYLVLGLLLLALTATLPAACGEATEGPEDCGPGEFFDEANERCESCPAVSEPQCEPGCGFELDDDAQGCPVLECAQPCKCSSGEFFSDETLDCEDCAASADPPAICFEDDQQDDE